MAPDVRPAAPPPSRPPRRQPAGWVLLLFVGCLNPQPDPFPQNVDVEAPGAPSQRSNGPSDVQFAPSAPAPGNAAGTATAPTGSTSNGNAAEQPPTPTAATPPAEGGAPEDAGAALPDAGATFDAGVPANGP